MIHNGVDVSRWRPGRGGGPPVWFGRIAPEKGTHLAIDAAALAGPAAAARRPDRRPRVLRAPRSGRGSRGRASSTSATSPTRSSCGLLGEASVALVTPCWDEPYGLVVAEALACGTPVCALRARRAAGAARRGLRPAGRAGRRRGAGRGDRPGVAGSRARRRAGTRCATCSLERDGRRATSSSTRRSPPRRSRDRLLRPSPGRRPRHPRGGDRARASATSRSPGSARARDPTTGAGPWLQLARDDDPPASDGADPTAGGALHWAPPGHPGLRERMAQIAAWVATHAPRLVVVDVSVEVTVLVRSMGVPTVVMGMPGARDDAAHQLAYRLAGRDPRARGPRGRDVLGGGARVAGEDRTPVGAISRFDGRAPARRRGSRRPQRARPLRARRHGADPRRSSRPPQRATPQWDVDRARPARRRAGSRTRGRCCAPPTSSSPTPARTRSPTSRPRGARPSSSRSRGRTTSSVDDRARAARRAGSPSSARAGRRRATWAARARTRRPLRRRAAGSAGAPGRVPRAPPPCCEELACAPR